MKQNFVDVFAAVKREYEREVERKAQEQLELGGEGRVLVLLRRRDESHRRRRRSARALH